VKHAKRVPTEGPVAAALARMAAGMMIGLLAMAGFNVADTYFVARLGTRQLAAMSFTFPVTMVIAGLAMGLGVGTSAIVANLIGQRLHHRVQALTTDALLLGLVLVSALVTVGMVTVRPLFSMLGATAETLPFVERYMHIWYVGMPFVVVPMIGNNAIRATGDTATPGLIMLVGLGLNAVFDPALIFGLGPIPAMGISGAALATVVSRAMSMTASLYVLARRKDMLTFERPTWRRTGASWRRILYIGLPAAASHMLMPISMGIVLRMVAWFGTAAVAAFGAASRLERVAVLPVIAVGASMMPLVGQNRGAGRFGRIYQAHRTAWRFDVLWGLGCAVALAAFSGPISRIFTRDPAVFGYLSKLLCIAPLAYGFKGLSHLAGSGMNAIERPFHAWAMMILRLLVLTIPLAALGGLVGGFVGLIAGLVVAEVMAGILAVRLTRALYDSSFAAQPAQG